MGEYVSHNVKGVTSLPDYRILVEFLSGERRIYDVKRLFGKFDAFLSLVDIKGLFELAAVDAGGCGVFWNDDLDLACNELYYNGEIVE